MIERDVKQIGLALVVLSLSVCMTYAQAPAPAAESVPGPSAASTAPATPASDVRTTYLLGADDQVVIHAVDVPDLSDKPLRIDPNGDLRIPVVGRIAAAGLTLEQLESAIMLRLKAILKEPDVTVTVTEFRSQPVSVVGAVGSPGVRQLDGSKTLIEILSMAGGVTQDAGSVVRVTRRLQEGRIPLAEAVNNTETGFSIVDIPIRPLMDAKTPEKNILVHGNDIIAVPRADVVYVIGEVGKPGSVPITRGQSVSIVEALSVTGGVLRTASASGARLLRPAGGKQARTEIPVDLKRIMQGKANDMALYPGDILVVPDSTSKRATSRAIEAAIQAGLIFGTYGVLR